MGLVIIFSQVHNINRDTHTVEERSIANEDLMEYVRLLMKDIIENKNYKHYKPIRETTEINVVVKKYIENEKVILLEPQTYMNLSGEAIKPMLDFYKVDYSNLLVIYDDIDVEPGKVKIRTKGGPGTHNGMKSVVKEIGTEEFPRIRVGIGQPIIKLAMIDYVIGYVPEKELTILEEGIEKAEKAIEEILKHGINYAMNKFN